MTQKTVFTRKYINGGFLLVLFAVMANTLVAYNAQRRLTQASNEVTKTHEAILGTEQLLETLLNAETGQRGFIITNSPEYLVPYHQGEQAALPRFNQLAANLIEDKESRVLLAQLEPVIQHKLAELKSTIKLAEEGHPEISRLTILSRQGKSLMDQIRTLLGQIEQRQMLLRKERITERERLTQRALVTIFAGAILTALMIGFAYYLSRRELKTIAQSQAALEEANALLETRVIERTAQLNDTNQELARSNRELQDFAFVASHDLQEPLRKIQAFGDLLKQDYGSALGTEGCDFIERMQNASRRMDRLIKDLLAFSRVTTKAQPFVPTDLNKVVKEVMTDLETRIKQTNGKVEIAELPVIDADALQMRQLLQNLIGNALKFHRPDVAPIIQINTATIESENPEADTPRMCEITVVDNGIGFDEKYLSRIFTPFQRLHGKNEFEGTGMGLAICRKVVERHRGTITATSQPGVGSTFIIRLPFTHLPSEETT